MTTILPSAYARTVGQIVTVGTDPYLDTSDGETSYVQMAASLWTVPIRSSNAYLTLPAVDVCSNPSKVELIVESRFVARGGASLPDDTFSHYCLARLQVSSATQGQTLTEYVYPGAHKSTTYTTEVLPMEDRFGAGTSPDWPEVAQSLAAGTAHLLFIAPSWADNYYDLRITYAALRWTCTTPPLRQNQRDDARQNQRTSQQLTVRQRGYL